MGTLARCAAQRQEIAELQAEVRGWKSALNPMTPETLAALHKRVAEIDDFVCWWCLGEALAARPAKGGE